MDESVDIQRIDEDDEKFMGATVRNTQDDIGTYSIDLFDDTESTVTGPTRKRVKFTLVKREASDEMEVEGEAVVQLEDQEEIPSEVAMVMSELPSPSPFDIGDAFDLVLLNNQFVWQAYDLEEEGGVLQRMHRVDFGANVELQNQPPPAPRGRERHPKYFLEEHDDIRGTDYRRLFRNYMKGSLQLETNSVNDATNDDEDEDFDFAFLNEEEDSIDKDNNNFYVYPIFPSVDVALVTVEEDEKKQKVVEGANDENEKNEKDVIFEHGRESEEGPELKINEEVVRRNPVQLHDEESSIEIAYGEQEQAGYVSQPEHTEGVDIDIDRRAKLSFGNYTIREAMQASKEINRQKRRRKERGLRQNNGRHESTEIETETTQAVTENLNRASQLKNYEEDSILNEEYEAMKEKCEHDDLAQLIRLVCTVKGTEPRDVNSWTSAVVYKLEDIGIYTTEDVMKSLPRINNRLMTAGYPRLHLTTLSVIAQVGTDRLLRQDRKSIPCPINRVSQILDRMSEMNEQIEDKREKAKRAETETETALSTMEKQEKSGSITMNTWLADSAATSHYCCEDNGMFNVKVIGEPIKIGNGKSLTATKVGDIKMRLNGPKGVQEIVLKEVKYIPDSWVNLFSIPTALRRGYKIGNDGLKLHLTKNGFTFRFNKLLKTGRGHVCGIDLYPVTMDVASAILAIGKEINANKAHMILGHPAEETVRRTAAFYGWKLTGKFEPCKFCGLAKARQANVNKKLAERSRVRGERLFIDTSSIKGQSYGSSKFWLLMVDDCTDYGISRFLNRKSETVQELKVKHDLIVKYIRCDDAPENRKAEKLCVENGINVQFEYTSPGTPQRNARVERKFATQYQPCSIKPD